MESPEHFPNYTYILPPDDDDGGVSSETFDMTASVCAVEKILKCTFRDKKLLEEALTHSSYTESNSCLRLAFIGDAALELAVSSYLYSIYPGINCGKLTLLQSANVSTEKLARVAVRHGLYNYIRRCAPDLDDQVNNFEKSVRQEDETDVLYGGLVNAPKVLADIVESVAAAVYIDYDFDWKAFWMIFQGILDPIVTLDVLERQPQPVTALFELCQKDGKQLLIRQGRQEEDITVNVYVDGKLVTSKSSATKESAKLQAATSALKKLYSETSKEINTDIVSQLDGTSEIEGAKQKLNQLCTKKKWPKPNYRTETKSGPAHEKRYVCSVETVITTGTYTVKGKERLQRKEAENSAASTMLHGLQQWRHP